MYNLLAKPLIRLPWYAWLAVIAVGGLTQALVIWPVTAQVTHAAFVFLLGLMGFSASQILQWQIAAFTGLAFVTIALVGGIGLRTVSLRYGVYNALLAVYVASFVRVIAASPSLALPLPDWGVAILAGAIVTLVIALVVSLLPEHFLIKVGLLVLCLSAIIILPQSNKDLFIMPQSSIATTVDRRFEIIKGQLPFDIYQPTYVPAGMALSKPALFDFLQRDDKFYVMYRLGEADVLLSEPLKRQEEIMNATDLCNIHTLYHSILDQKVITDYQASLNSVSRFPCNLVGTTSGGQQVFTQTMNPGQYYYVQIDNTVIIVNFAKNPPAAVQDEMLEIMGSMEKVDKSGLIVGHG